LNLSIFADLKHFAAAPAGLARPHCGAGAAARRQCAAGAAAWLAGAVSRPPRRGWRGLVGPVVTKAAAGLVVRRRGGGVGVRLRCRMSVVQLGRRARRRMSAAPPPCRAGVRGPTSEGRSRLFTDLAQTNPYKSDRKLCRIGEESSRVHRGGRCGGRDGRTGRRCRMPRAAAAVRHCAARGGGPRRLATVAVCGGGPRRRAPAAGRGCWRPRCQNWRRGGRDGPRATGRAGACDGGLAGGSDGGLSYGGG
jgi:hypothetical protein